MKSKISISVIIIAVSFGFFSCQSSGTKDKKVGTLETSSVDAEQLKEDIVDIIMSLPDNSETVKLINETGAAYIAGLTLEDLQTNNLLTRAANAKAYGSVLFDLAYASTYNQVNTFSKLMEINKSLVRKLGFEDFINEQNKYQKRFLENKSDQDSVDQIVAELLTSANEYIQENGNAADISMVFAGATTKSIYVISNLTVFAMNNDKLVNLMKNQKDRLESALDILEMAGDNQEVKEMADAIKPIIEVFNSTEPFDLDAVEKIREMSSFTMQ